MVEAPEPRRPSTSLLAKKLGCSKWAARDASSRQCSSTWMQPASTVSGVNAYVTQPGSCSRAFWTTGRRASGRSARCSGGTSMVPTMRISTGCHASAVSGNRGADRPLSLASLSALHVPPPDLVRYAADAGFDLIGALRLVRASDGSGFDLVGDAALRRATVAALADAGLGVLDVEVFRVRPGSSAADAEPLLAIGAELGAEFLLTAVADPEPDRRAAVFAELSALANGYGLRCMVEPMVFSALRTP